LFGRQQGDTACEKSSPTVPKGLVLCSNSGSSLSSFITPKAEKWTCLAKWETNSSDGDGGKLVIAVAAVLLYVIFVVSRVVTQHSVSKEQWEERIVVWYAQHSGTFQ